MQTIRVKSGLDINRQCNKKTTQSQQPELSPTQNAAASDEVLFQKSTHMHLKEVIYEASARRNTSRVKICG